MRRALAAILLTGMFLWGACARTERFAVGVMRLDGHLVPIAAHDNGRWERAWPEAGEAPPGGAPTLENTPSVWSRRGEPVPSIWQLWPASGSPPVSVQTGEVELVDAHCQSQVALQTDLPPTDGERHDEFGVAVDSPAVPVGLIETVTPPDASWTAAHEAVLGRFASLEAATVARGGVPQPGEPPGPVPGITALYREADSPDSPMYFVAEKRYPDATRPPELACDAVTLVTGWLMPHGAGSYAVIDPRTFVTDCDGKETRTGVPLAAIHTSDRTFWVLQEHGYEDETYVIAAIGSSEVQYVVEAYGGGC